MAAVTPPITDNSKADTKQQLIDAAEQLFAEQGVDNVSSVDIVRAAKQKNRSALQYHFGDKSAVIHAVLDKHSLGIAEARQAMLDQLEKNNSTTLRGIINALVEPVAAKLDDPDGGHCFLKLNSQLMANEAYAQLRRERSLAMPHLLRFQEMLQRTLPMFNSGDLHARMLLVDCLLFHGLSTYLPMMQTMTPERFIENLCQSMVGVLSNTLDR
jgi:AcrR family transcriptional regulator